MKKQVFFTIFLLFATLFVSAQIMWSARYDSDGAYDAQEFGAAGTQILIDGASTGDKIVIYNQEQLPIDPLSVGVEITIEYNYADTYTPVLAEGEVYNPTTGKIWMDRNLGASQVATSSTDAAAYGDLYQWGRAADGHQTIVWTSPTTSTGAEQLNETTTLSTTDTPGHDDFILAPNSPYDWLTPQDNDLWQGVSGTNNPCPSGYRLPTEAEWQAELDSWDHEDAAGAFASPLKLPVAGYRYYRTGSLLNVGSYGLYWSATSATVDGTRARSLIFYSSSSNDASMFSNIRADGSSVRCLKD